MKEIYEEAFRKYFDVMVDARRNMRIVRNGD